MSFFHEIKHDGRTSFVDFTRGLSDSCFKASETLEFVQPGRLAIMLRRKDAGIEKHKDDDKPIKRLRLHRLPTAFPTTPVPLQ